MNLVYIPISILWWEGLDCQDWSDLGIPDYPLIINDADTDYFAEWIGGPYPKQVILNNDMEIIHISLGHNFPAIESGILLGLSQNPENADMEPDFHFGVNSPIAPQQELNQIYPSAANGADGRIHAVWMGESWNDNGIFHSYSDDLITFSEPVRLSDNNASPLPSPGNGPVITAAGGTIAVVWADDRANSESSIYGAVSYDNGFSWEEETELSDIPEYHGNPDIDIGPDGRFQLIYLILDQFQNTQGVRYTYSTDTSFEFVPSVVIDLTGGYGLPCSTDAPDLDIADNGDMYIAYRNNVFNERDPYLTKILNGTTEAFYVIPLFWSGISFDDCPDSGPAIALNHNRVGASFSAGLPSWGYIGFAVQENLWLDPVTYMNPDELPIIQIQHDVAMEGEYLHTVWTEISDDDSDIFYGYAKSYENGVFNLQQISSESSLGDSQQTHPAITSDGDNLTAVWSDDRAGMSKIYFATTHPDAMVPGDVNQDGQLNILDIVGMVGFITGATIPDSNQFAAADINNDGVLNVLDIVMAVNLITGA